MLPLSAADIAALITGEVVAAFVPRGTVTEGDEVNLGAGMAVVTAVDPTALLDATAEGAGHVVQSIPGGDLVVLRVYDGDRPVLSDEVFWARVRSIEGAMR